MYVLTNNTLYAVCGNENMYLAPIAPVGKSSTVVRGHPFYALIVNGNTVDIRELISNGFTGTLNVTHSAPVVAAGFAKSNFCVSLDIEGNLRIVDLFTPIRWEQLLPANPIGMVTGDKGALIWYPDQLIRLRITRDSETGEYNFSFDKQKLPEKAVVLETVAWGSDYAYLTTNGALYLWRFDEETSTLLNDGYFCCLEDREYRYLKLAANDQWLAVYLPIRVRGRWPICIYNRDGRLSKLAQPAFASDTNTKGAFVVISDDTRIMENPMAIVGAGDQFILVYEGGNLYLANESYADPLITNNLPLGCNFSAIVDIVTDDKFIYIATNNQDAPVGKRPLNADRDATWQFARPDYSHEGRYYSVLLGATFTWDRSNVLIAQTGERNMIATSERRIILPAPIVKVYETWQGVFVRTADKRTYRIKEGFVADVVKSE